MRKPIRVLTAALVAVALGAATPVSAQQKKIKIGFISTMSGPAGAMGEAMKNSVDLALEHLGHKMGGVPVEVIYGDDQFKPDVGLQVVNEMLKKDQVDIVAGIIWSHVMLAVVPVVTGAGKLMIGTNAGASPLAGKLCNDHFFTTSWNNDQTPEAMGKYLQDLGINDLYVMAPNYQAGKDMVAGLKRTYKGNIVDEVYTKPNQTDYQAEISQLRAKKPKAVYAFYPGGMGVQFLKQYNQAGLMDQIPLYTVHTVDELSIPAIGDAAIGQMETRFWSPDIKVPASQKYVADYRKKYGKWPVFYGAQSYDGMMLIDSGVRALKGNIGDTKGMIRELRKANYDSIRGKFSFNVNHVPIQNFYLLKTVKESNDIVMKIQKTIFENYKDSYYQDCPMKW